VSHVLSTHGPRLHDPPLLRLPEERRRRLRQPGRNLPSNPFSETPGWLAQARFNKTYDALAELPEECQEFASVHYQPLCSYECLCGFGDACGFGGVC